TALMDNIKMLKADVIEVFNPRTINKNHNVKAFQYAEEKNIPKAVGSDSHTRFELGKTYVIMEDFYSKKEFLQNLKKAQLVTNGAPIWIHAFSKTTRKLRKLGLLKR
ncbi:MAG: PHP-associated domain-containing protein, partial [Candidatus Nanoarchaeia archaeon]